MTEAEFWQKYTHCPKCREYTFQSVCSNCIWYLGKDNSKTDLFYPTEECEKILAKLDKSRKEKANETE